jgi:poly(3-hydroxybutyrate) depolymerase
MRCTALQTYMHSRRWAAGGFLFAAVVLLVNTGCAVPQPRGKGELSKVREPSTGRSYYLYLPESYVNAEERDRRSDVWPLVVTFHGMVPYDTANAQAREWECEADRYGYIVIAPIMSTVNWASPIVGGFPVNRVTSSFEADERGILACMDHATETTYASPEHVLSTSFSSGGYMAHYMLNRHPERFSCLAVRQSNFSHEVLSTDTTSRSRYHPILILSTQNDVAICKEETREAIQWYETHGYENLAWITMNKLGHARTPDIAADFFARMCGVSPSRPPEFVFKRQVIDGNARGLALLKGDFDRVQRPGNRGSNSDRSRSQAHSTPARPVDRKTADVRHTNDAETRAATERTTAQRTPAHRRRGAGPLPTGPMPRVSIDVPSSIGFEPLLLVYSADCPRDWYRQADFHWTLNGEKIGTGLNGQRTVAQPGDYDLQLRVIAPNGREYRAHKTIRVLRNVETSSAQ